MEILQKQEESSTGIEKFYYNLRTQMPNGTELHYERL